MSFTIHCASTNQTIVLDEEQNGQMLAANFYQDVLQVISRVTSANIHEIMVPSCHAGTPEEQEAKVTKMKEANFVAFKLLDDYYREETPNDKAVLEIFPFAKDQPSWVIQILKDNYNVRAPFDLINFFNTGGELAYTQITEFKDLTKGSSSHEEKVNGLEIQDLHIQKMNEEDRKTYKGSTTTINVDGKDHEEDLDDNMTIEKFKSFVLTLTKSKPFFLKFMMGNNQTLGELKKKTGSDSIMVTKRKQDEKYMIPYIDLKGAQKEFECYRKTKLAKFLKEQQMPKEKEDTHIWKITFEDGTDALSYAKKQNIIPYQSEKFDHKSITFADLGINRFSQLKIDLEEGKLNLAMAAEDIIIKHENYIQFEKADEKNGQQKLLFDTDKTVQQLIDSFALKSDPIERKFLVALNEENQVIEPSKSVIEILSDNKTVTVDYKDHFVLEFVTLDEESEANYQHKFVPKLALQAQKIKVLADLSEKTMKKEKSVNDEDKLIKFEDVAWGEHLNNDELKTELKKHLKFIHNGISVEVKAPRDLIPDYPDNVFCMFGKIRVILDKFDTDHQHYVNTLEDNWIPKEYMQVVYDQKLFDQLTESSQSQNKLLKNKPTDNFSKPASADSQDFETQMKTEIGNLMEDEPSDSKSNWLTIKKDISAADGEEIREDLYQALVKLYTSQSLYPTLAKRFATGQYKEAQNYLKLLMVNVNQFAHAFKYTTFNKEIYRGASSAVHFDKNNYTVGSIGQWPCFTSCTKNKELAQSISKNLQFKQVDGKREETFNGTIVLFRVYLNDQNETATSVDLSSETSKAVFTYFPQEEEVLLLPNFTFQVTNVYESSKKKEQKGKDAQGNPITFQAKIVEITVAELPYTNLNKLKQIYESTLIWYSTTQGENDKAQELVTKMRADNVTSQHCKNRTELFDAVEQSIRVTMIVSDAAGYEMAKNLMTNGINFNNTICNIIVIGKEKEFFNKKTLKGLVHILKDSEDLAVVAKEKVDSAFAGQSFKKFNDNRKEELEKTMKEKCDDKGIAPIREALKQ